MSEPVRTKSRRTLTEADIERLADRAAQGFDLTRWRARPGRPSLDPDAGVGVAATQRPVIEPQLAGTLPLAHVAKGRR